MSFFVLPFEIEDDRRSNSKYYIPKVERKDYNVMIDVKSLFDQPILMVLNIWKY